MHHCTRPQQHKIGSKMVTSATNRTLNNCKTGKLLWLDEWTECGWVKRWCLKRKSLSYNRVCVRVYASGGMTRKPYPMHQIRIIYHFKHKECSIPFVSLCIYAIFAVMCVYVCVREGLHHTHIQILMGSKWKSRILFIFLQSADSFLILCGCACSENPHRHHFTVYSRHFFTRQHIY